jgi:translation initiation factor eIF-2B subunit delta
MVAPEIAKAVEAIRQDRVYGARELALTALRALWATAPSASPQELRQAAQALALARPMMAAVANALAAAWAAIAERGHSPAPLQELMQRLEESPRRMAEAGRDLLPRGTVMTYSYSSTVIEVLGQVRPYRAIVSESRPLNEGLRTARRLAEQGISLTLITDAQMGLFVREAEAVVVGADSIFPDGSLVNKIGTRLLALAAREAKVPFYVLAETMKVSALSAPKRFVAEEGNRKEVSRETWLQVRNVYFEVTPARLVTAYITDEGVLRPRELRRYAQEAERRWRLLMASQGGAR